MKKLLLPFSFAWLLAIFSGCSRHGEVENQAVGYAQGTTYQIKFVHSEKVDWQLKFDSIFRSIDQSMSTYLSGSLIDLVNKGDTLVKVDPMFIQVLERSTEIAEETEGLFDPTVGPLVRFWGFGNDQNRAIDSEKVDSVRALVGYQRIIRKSNSVSIPKGSGIDFNAIAQGFTVDEIARYLRHKGVVNYMVEVGGEVRTSGVNVEGQVWRIGIDKPSEEMDMENRLQLIVELKDKALATSGNYRKFWVDTVSGMKYSHTIDPVAGKPAHNSLLSASIIASNCMDADAYATACMVMGLDKAMKFVGSRPDLEGYFISSDQDGNWQVHSTKGFEVYVRN